MKRCQNIWAGPPPLIRTKSKRRAVFPQEKVPQLKGNLDINHVEKLSKNILVDQKYQLFQMTLFDNRNLVDYFTTYLYKHKEKNQSLLHDRERF